MTEPWRPVVREVVYVEWKEKLRTAVVLRVVGDYAQLIYSSSVKRDLKPRCSIEANSRFARSLGLQGESFFYSSQVLSAHVSALKPKRPPCPRDLYIALGEVAQEQESLEEYLARKAAAAAGNNSSAGEEDD